MLIKTLQWLQYPDLTIRKLSRLNIYDWTALLRPTIEIPIKVWINGFYHFLYLLSKYNMHLQTKKIKHQTDILLSFQTLYAIVSMFGQILVNQYFTNMRQAIVSNSSICCIGMWWPITRMITLPNCFIHYISVLNFYEICTTW